MAPDAIYFLALSYHEMGADDWATDYLTMLAEKYPDSKVTPKGRSLLAKIGGTTPGTLAAKGPVSSLLADASPSTTPENGSTLPNPAETLDPLGIPSATSLGQAFTACRLGAWC